MILSGRRPTTHIGFRPYPRFTETLDQVSAREQHDLVFPPRTIPHLHPAFAILAVQHLVEMIQNDGGPLIFWLTGFPGVDHQPRRGVFHGEFAHPHSVVSGRQTGFLVVRRAIIGFRECQPEGDGRWENLTRADSHWGIVTSHDLERLALDNLVFGHLEHSPVTVAV